MKRRGFVMTSYRCFLCSDLHLENHEVWNKSKYFVMHYAISLAADARLQVYASEPSHYSL